MPRSGITGSGGSSVPGLESPLLLSTELDQLTCPPTMDEASFLISQRGMKTSPIHPKNSFSFFPQPLRLHPLPLPLSPPSPLYLYPSLPPLPSLPPFLLSLPLTLFSLSLPREEKNSFQWEKVVAKATHRSGFPLRSFGGSTWSEKLPW